MAEPKPQAHPITEAELQQLPRWAIIAFAARCARRVQPLFTHSWIEAPRSRVDAIDKAISMAEVAARHGVASTSAADAAVCASAEAAARASVRAGAASAAAAAAASAVYASAAAAAHASAAASARASSAAASAAATSAAARASARAPSGSAFSVGAANAAFEAEDAARADYAMLQRLARDKRWTNESPVDVALLGPLWPEGTKPQWA